MFSGFIFMVLKLVDKQFIDDIVMMLSFAWLMRQICKGLNIQATRAGPMESSQAKINLLA